MARYVVTGGCGFIGSNLVKAIRRDGHDVIVLDNLSSGRADSIPTDVPIVQADVADTAAVYSVLEKDADGCFHLAANPSVSQSMEDYAGCNRTNLGGTISVFDAVSKLGVERDRPVPVVFASSCAVYGNLQTMPLSEDMETKPLSSYGADKLCGEIHARMAAGAYNIQSVGLRFFNVFGPGQRPESVYSGVLSVFCRALAAGRSVTIFGDGRQKRDFVYVDDVVEALRVAMRKAGTLSPAVLNVCTGNGLTLLEVGKTISEICGTKFQPEFNTERAGDIKISVGDPTKCAAEMNWESRTEIVEGLKRTIEWMADQEFETRS